MENFVIDTQVDLKRKVVIKATINKELYVNIADERFYELYNDMTYYSFDKLIFDEDVDSFKNAISQVKEGNAQYLSVRFLVKDNIYRWKLLKITIADMKVNDDIFYDVEISDTINISEKFQYMDYNINKYRNFMALADVAYFEYDFKTKGFTIYMYFEGRTITIENCTLEEWKKDILRQEAVDPEYISMFEQMCDCMENGMDLFSFTMNSSILKKGNQKEMRRFKGATIYKGMQKDRVVGIISGTARNKDYYFNSESDNKDKATGLMNKSAIIEFAKSRIDSAKRAEEKPQLIFMMCDIDDFKEVNDTYGHMFGDEVIAKVATIIKQVIGERGTVGRFGGDEYFAVIENVGDENSLKMLLKTIRTNVFWAYKDIMPKFKLSCSIGTAELFKDAYDYDTLFKLADMALYIAKEKGKNRYIIYDVKKHGKLKEDAEGAIGVYNLNIKEGKHVFVDNLLKRICRRRFNVQEIISDMKNIYDLEVVNVYIGDGLELKYSTDIAMTGNCAYVEDEEYKKFFKDNLNVLNNINHLKDKCPDIADKLAQDGVLSMIQVFEKNDKAQICGVVECSVSRTGRKWSDFDKNSIYYISSLLLQVIIEDKM